MSNDNTKIIEKIQKLLALSGSCNKNEAESAMAKAQELMAKHNLDMQSIDNHDSEYVREKSETYKRESVEAKYINAILADYFFVRLVKSSRREGNYMSIVGEKANVKIAVHMRTYLTNVFKVLWKEYKKETGCPNNSRQSFYMGLWKGFSAKMDEQRKETEERYDMVLVDDPKVAEKVMEIFGKTTRGSKRRVNSGDDSATSAGYAQGQRLNVNSGAVA